MRFHLSVFWRLALVAGLGLALSPRAAPRAVEAAVTLPAGFVDEFVAPVPRPTALAATPDGRLLVASQGGQLWVYQASLLPQPALDLAPVICDNVERGLEGVAVDPDFAANHYIYVYYTFNKYGACPQADPLNPANPVNRVSRFTLPDTNVISPDSEAVLVDNITQLYGIHNGGDLHFGADGLLYISTGDGAGPSATYQNPRLLSYLGAKILRIAPDGSIPPDNPYASAPDSRRCGDPGGAPPGTGPCQETFAYGLRNPFRFAFKPGTNEFYINDVGQHTWEEVDQGQANADYGWNVREGPCPFSTPNCDPATTSQAGFTPPIHYYNHTTGCHSITGAAFVPAGIWPLAYDNAYLFGDYGCGTIWRLVGSGPTSTRVEFATGLGSLSLVTMTFAPYGQTQALYYSTYGGSMAGALSQLRRIRYTGQTNRPPTAALSADPVYGDAPLEVTLSAAGSMDPDAADTLVYDWDLGDGTLLTGTSALTVTHLYPTGVYTASLRARDNRGAASDTLTVRLDSGNTPPMPALERVGPDEPFAVGEPLSWQGSAADAEDGSAGVTLTWEARLHHVDAQLPGNTHWHPYLPPTPGEVITVTAPAPEDFNASALSFLEVRLNATDSWGLSAVITTAVQARRVPLQFETDPPGFELLRGGEAVRAPHAAIGWENWAFAVEAPLQTDPAGNRWGWQAWEAGSGALAATRTITTPATAMTYTATFTTTTVAPVPQVTALEPASGPAGGVARPFTLTVTGKNFASDAVLVWDGQPLTPTVFISSTQLRLVAPAELLNAAGPVPVTALNPAPGGGMAEPATFVRLWRVVLPFWLRAGP